MKVSNRQIGRDNPVFVIAEAGTAHGGDLAAANELIHAAADAGSDCVKFQIVIAKEIVHPKAGSVALPGGNISLYDRFLTLERPLEFYAACKEQVEKRGLVFLCSVFGEESASMLDSLDAQAVKIASPEINHFPLLEHCSNMRLTTIISAGVSTLGDIEAALSHLNVPKALLHCVTSYPAPEEEYNLRIIRLLSSLFGLPVGVSDHSLDPKLVPSIAVAGGASIIEKHITLSRSGEGLDDPIALDPNDFAEMIASIRAFERTPEGERHRMLEETFGTTRVEAVLGTGIKRLAPSEASSYQTTNRSIISTSDIQSGEMFDASNTALLRSETNIRPGLHPSMWKYVLGRHARGDVQSGTGIRWSDVG